MSLADLTSGAIPRMLAEDESKRVQSPVCQVLTVKKIQSQASDAPERYRVILSDGQLYAQAMLSSQTRHLVETGQLDKNCLLRVDHYIANSVQGRRILILLELEVVAPPTAERLGDPQNVDKVGSDGGAQPQQHAAAPVKSENGSAAPFAYGQGPAARKPAPAMDLTGMPIYPIEGLSPYQNKWTIKARVTTKSEVKHWSNQRGEGKLFSCNLLDESGEIKATGFNDAVDRFYNVLKEGHVYFISKARVNIARQKFKTLSNEYEITFERDTQVNECTDPTDVPEVKFNFRALDQLDGIEPRQTTDIIGIVETVGDISEIISKASQKPVNKREITLVDQSGMSVRLTLWGKTAESYGTPAGYPGCGPDDKPVIAFKGVSVSDFGGRSLSMFSSSTMHVNPDIPEAHGLRGWYDSEGTMLGDQNRFKTYNSMGLGGTGTGASADGGFNPRERKSIMEVKDLNLGMNDKPDFFNLMATVVYVKSDNLTYPACPSDGCNKKVTEQAPQNWRCEKCDRSFEAPQHRYILQANVQDPTGQIWINGFNDVGEQLIGRPAGDLVAMKDEGNDAEFADVLARANGQMFIYNIRAKQDMFNDAPRVRYTVTKMSPVNFEKEAKDLVQMIKENL